jgi:glycosyltransferase involved in cell wall biosynthesis
MACGATAVLPARGGVTEFARHGVNAVLVDTSDLEATVSAVATLVEDRSLLEGMKANAAETAAAFSPVRAALSEYSLFCHEHARRRAMLV